MDPFNLSRFVQAQERQIDIARAELRSGRKCGHWMWYIFPQMKGLGISEAANYYGISCRAEAAAYLSHTVLGPRLVECTELVNLVGCRSAVDIFGYPDWLKFRSSVTLFAALNSKAIPFKKALDKYFAGEPDRRTLSLLQS